MIGSIPPLITCLFVFNLAFILLIYRNKESYYMLPLCAATVWWHFSWVFIFQLQDMHKAYLIAKIGHIGIIYLPIGVIWLFSRYFNNPKRWLIFGHIYYILCITLLFSTDLVIKGVKHHSYGYYPLAGPLHSLYLVLIAICVSVSILAALKHRSKTNDYLERTQVEILVVAIIVFCMGGIDFLHNYDLATFYPFGFVFSTFFLLIIFFSIFRFSLFSKDKQIFRMQALMINQEKLAMVGTLSAGIAHQLGNTLNNIATALLAIDRMAQRNTFSKEKLSELTDSMKISVEVSIDIIHGLDFASKSNVEKSEIFLKEVVDTSIILMKGKFLEDATVRKLIDPSIQVYASRNSLLQIFMNLISNSIDATDPSSKCIIEIKAINSNSSVTIEFSDNGLGIPDSIIDHVFDPFFTTKSSDKGSGMGLFVVNEEIKNNNGSIKLARKDLKDLSPGSCFVITLPKHKQVALN